MVANAGPSNMMCSEAVAAGARLFVASKRPALAPAVGSAVGSSLTYRAPAAVPAEARQRCSPEKPQRTLSRGKVQEVSYLG